MPNRFLESREAPPALDDHPDGCTGPCSGLRTSYAERRIGAGGTCRNEDPRRRRESGCVGRSSDNEWKGSFRLLVRSSFSAMIYCSLVKFG